MRKLIATLFIVALAFPAIALAEGNSSNDSYNEAKRMLERQVYFDHRETIYCRAHFDAKKSVSLPEGFETPAHGNRAKRVEWEHAVPAENFGRSFREWREGDPECAYNGQPFKGRKCAEKVSMAYRYMQSDMYNLFPAIGAVNAVRSNFQYSELPDEPPFFGSCPAKLSGRRFEPPDHAKGELARAGLYMDWAYPQYSLSRQQRRLFEAWDRTHPVTEWECVRARRISRLQGNENPFVMRHCQ